MQTQKKTPFNAFLRNPRRTDGEGPAAELTMLFCLKQTLKAGAVQLSTVRADFHDFRLPTASTVTGFTASCLSGFSTSYIGGNSRNFETRTGMTHAIARSDFKAAVEYHHAYPLS